MWVMYISGWYIRKLVRAFQLSIEAQNVIALRMLRLASGDVRGQAELNRMVIEKIAAAAEAQVAAAAALLNGHKDHVIAGKALTVYKKRVRANRRRLSQS